MTDSKKINLHCNRYKIFARQTYFDYKKEVFFWEKELATLNFDDYYDQNKFLIARKYIKQNNNLGD